MAVHDIDHFDAVASTSATSSLAVPSCVSSSAASSTCSTPASSVSGTNSTRTGRTLRSGRTTSLAGLAPILPLSVSTRSMARIGAADLTKQSGLGRTPATVPTGRKVKRKAPGASRSVSVFDENTETGIPAGKKSLQQSVGSVKLADKGLDKPGTRTLGDKAQTARAPLTMTRNVQNNSVVRPVSAMGRLDAGADNAKGKAMSVKRKVDAIYKDEEQTVLHKRLRKGPLEMDEVDASGVRGRESTTLVIPSAHSELEEEDEEDEPMPTRFASLRHRPPTPPRMMSLDDRRKSMCVAGKAADEASEDDGRDLAMRFAAADDLLIPTGVEGSEGSVDHQPNSIPKMESIGPAPVTPRRTELEDVRMIPEESRDGELVQPRQAHDSLLETPSKLSVSTDHRSSTLGSPITISRPGTTTMLTPARQQTSLGVSPLKTPGLLSRFGTPRRFAPLPRAKAPSPLLPTNATLTKSTETSAALASTAEPAVTVEAKSPEITSDSVLAVQAAADAVPADALLVAPSSGASMLPPAARARQPPTRAVSGTVPKTRGLMAPPSLPTRSLRSSTSSRSLATVAPRDTVTRSTVQTSSEAGVVPTHSGIPRSSTLYASTISSAAKTSLPPPASTVPASTAGSRKKAPLGEARRPGMPHAAANCTETRSADGAMRRKSSYPSSLSVGGGQPGISRSAPSMPNATRQIGRPRDRTLSGPVPASVLASFRTEGPNVDLLDGGDPDEMEEGVTIAPSLGSPKRPSPLRACLSAMTGVESGSSGGTSAGSPGRRVVSEPVQSLCLARPYAESKAGDADQRQLAASTSAATRGPRESLGLSMSERRQGAGWNDTSKSFVGLAAALERLKRKDSMVGKGVRASMGGTGLGAVVDNGGGKDADRSMANADAGGSSGMVSDRLAAVHRPRHSIAVGPSSSLPGRVETVSTAVSSASSSTQVTGIPRAISLKGTTAKETGSADTDPLAKAKTVLASRCLKGVVAVVDVWTADGADSSAIFEDMLRGMGARVLARPSDSVTHVIYKSGKGSTLTWYRKAAAAAAEAAEDAEHRATLAREEAEAKGMVMDIDDTTGPAQREAEGEGHAAAKQAHVGPYIVGLSWVTRCKAEGKRVGEENFVVDVKQEDVFGKRRKSMDPKAFNLSERLAATPSGRAPLSALSQVSEARRKTMLYAPKVGSPLKRAYR